MGRFGEELVTILTAVIGLAILAVLVSQRANTSQVIQSASSGFSNILQSAEAPVTGYTGGNYLG